MKFNRRDTAYINENPTIASSKRYYIIFNKAERKILDSLSKILISKNFDSFYDKNDEEPSNIKYKFKN